jgi:hypothetical protein
MAVGIHIVTVQFVIPCSLVGSVIVTVEDDAAFSSRKLVSSYKTSRCHKPKDHNLKIDNRITSCNRDHCLHVMHRMIESNFSGLYYVKKYFFFYNDKYCIMYFSVEICKCKMDSEL